MLADHPRGVRLVCRIYDKHCLRAFGFGGNLIRRTARCSSTAATTFIFELTPVYKSSINAASIQEPATPRRLRRSRTSCRSPLANQMRLILHTGAYWLLLDLRAAIPSWNPLRHTEFATISSVSLEDRQPYHRAREPHSYRARLMLPGGRDVQSCRAQAATVWTISSGAMMPRRAPIHSPPTRRQRHRLNQSAELGARRTDARAPQKLAFRSCVRVHKVG